MINLIDIIKMKKNAILTLILFLLFLNFIRADIINPNPGGGINPIGGLGNPNSCAVLYTCSGLGYNCGTWDDGCGTALTCGTCGSGFTCSSGTCVSSGGGGAGGVGGGGGVGIPGNATFNIQISPNSFSLKLAINTNKQEFITISNKGTKKQILSINQSGLDNKIILTNTSVSINPGETKQLEIIFVASNQTGIYTGTITIGSFAIPVTLDVKTKLLLFDSNILVLNKNYQVSKQEKLRTKVTLVPMGDKERLDVRLNYAIKDYSGKVYITQSETVMAENRVDFRKDFDIGGLPLGKYIVSLELIYPGGVAPSSSHFEIVERTPVSILGDIMYYLILMIIVISIIMVAIMMGDKIRRGETI